MNLDPQPIIDWLNANPEWVLFSLGFTAFLESLALVGIIIPGVAILFLIAAVAGNADIALSHALLAGAIGAILGDVVSFYIGHFFREKLPYKWPFSRYPKALAAGADFFQEHGGKSVVIGRFVGPIRPVLPIVAGMMGMSQLRFISFNITSAIAWSPFYILPGYWSGAAIQQAWPDNALSTLISFLSGLVLIALVFRFASLRIQAGSPWYVSLEASKEQSPLLQKIWHFLTAHHQEPKEFPLGSLLLLAFSTLFFVVWTAMNILTPWLTPVDQLVLSLVTLLRNEWVDTISVSFTLIGNEAFLYLSFTLIIALLALKKQWLAALHMIAGGLMTAAITHGFKAWFAIPRPDLVVSPPESFAYPSGHSSGAVIFWGLLASFVAQDLTPNKRWQIYLLFFIPMLLIAFSRLVLGIHWFTDIVGGITLGLAICSLTRVSYSRYKAKPLNLTNENRLELYSFFACWIICAVVYLLFCFDSTLAQFQIR